MSKNSVQNALQTRKTNKNGKVKRLNNNNNNNAAKIIAMQENNRPNTSNNNASRKPNFLDILEEYKQMRSTSQQNQQPKAHSSNSNPIKEDKEKTIVVISDEELEEGEITDDLIAESFDEIVRSQQITDDDEKMEQVSSSGQNVFYEDRKLNEFKSTDVPMYFACGGSSEPLDDSSNQLTEVESGEIICLDSSHDDSVIIVGEVPQDNNKLNKPQFLSPRAIYNLFKKVPLAKSPLSPSKPRRSPKKTQRRMAYTEMKKFEKTLTITTTTTKNNSNGPSTSKASEKQTNIVTITSSESTTANEIKTNSSIVVATEPKIPQKRIILLDGSNIAMSFTSDKIGKISLNDNNKAFSAEGTI